MRFDELTFFEDKLMFELNCDFLKGLHEGGIFVQTLREIYGDKYVFSKTTRKDAEDRYAEELEAYKNFVDGGCKNDETYYRTYRAFHNEFKFMLTLMDALGKDFLTKDDYDYALANADEIYDRCLAVRKSHQEDEPAKC